MKGLFTTAFALLLILTGCTDQSDGSMPEGSEDSAVAVDSSMLRPDPNNPANDELTVPVGWEFRFDDDAEVTVGADADSFDVFFVSMTPGWHVTTTHGSGIFWHPASTAEGSYEAMTGIHLFAPGERNEGFGLFVGGKNLKEPDQTYVYFLIRRSGEFLVKQRTGEETETIYGWETNDAIHPWTEESQSTVYNELAVRVSDDTVSFLVNGTEVHSMPKGDLSLDGIVGLRMNHGLNMHVEKFGVEPLM